MKRLVFLLTSFLFVLFLSAEEAVVNIEVPVQEVSEVALSKEQLEELAPVSVTDVLQALGVTVRSLGGYGSQTFVQSRGFTENGVRVIVDGVEVSSALNSYFDLSTFDWSNVSSVRYVESPYNETAVSSSGGGCLYITTSSDEGVSFGISALSYSGGNQFTVYDSVLDGSSLISASGKSTRKADVKNKVQLVDMVKSWFQGYETIDGVGIAVGGSYISALNEYYVRRNQWWVEEGQEVRSGSVNLGFDLDCFGGSLSWKDSFNRNSRLSGRQDDLVLNQTVNYVRPEFFLGHELSLTLGILYEQFNYEESSHKAVSYRPVFSFSREEEKYKSSLSGSTVICRGSSTDIADSSSINGNLVYSFSYLISDLLRLQNLRWYLSLPETITYSYTKAEGYGLNNNFKFNPAVGTRINFPNLGIDLTVDAFTMYRVPDFEELYWNSSGFNGNPNLVPEEGYGVELALKKSFFSELASGGSFFGSVYGSVYRMFYDKSIHWFQGAGGWRPENISAANYYGFTLRSELGLTTGKGSNLSLNLFYKYDYNDIVGHEKRIQWTPLVTVSGGCSYKPFWFDGFSSSLMFIWVGDRYADNLNLVKVDPYLDIDLNFSYSLSSPSLRVSSSRMSSLSSSLRMFCNIRNLLSQTYYCYNQSSAPSRSVEIGVTFKY